MRFWKLPLLSLVYLLNTWAFASVRYECSTQGVPLFSSEGRQISDQRDAKAVYTPDVGVNANVVVGDRHYLIWQQQDTIAILKNGPEGLQMHRVLPMQKTVNVELPLNYMGEPRLVRCSITQL